MAEIISILENDLNNYDRIIFFDTPDLISGFLQSKAASITDLNILVLSLGQTFPQLGNIAFREISEEEAGQIKELYYMYQFSDRFLFISKESANYAGLFHFVDTGILDTEEVFEVLLR